MKGLRGCARDGAADAPIEGAWQATWHPIQWINALANPEIRRHADVRLAKIGNPALGIATACTLRQ